LLVEGDFYCSANDCIVVATNFIDRTLVPQDVVDDLFTRGHVGSTLSSGCELRDGSFGRFLRPEKLPGDSFRISLAYRKDRSLVRDSVACSAKVRLKRDRTSENYIYSFVRGDSSVSGNRTTSENRRIPFEFPFVRLRRVTFY